MSEHKIPKPAEEVTYHLEVTANDLMAIGSGLQELRNKVAAPLLAKLNGQLMPQIQANSAMPEGEIAQEAAAVVAEAVGPRPKKSIARA